MKRSLHKLLIALIFFGISVVSCDDIEVDPDIVTFELRSDANGEELQSVRQGQKAFIYLKVQANSIINNVRLYIGPAGKGFLGDPIPILTDDSRYSSNDGYFSSDTTYYGYFDEYTVDNVYFNVDESEEIFFRLLYSTQNGGESNPVDKKYKVSDFMAAP